jgi:hypothetical protein
MHRAFHILAAIEQLEMWMICASFTAVVIKVRVMRSLLFYIAEAAGSCGYGVRPVATSSASFISRTVAMQVFQVGQLPSLNFSILGDEVDISEI